MSSVTRVDIDRSQLLPQSGIGIVDSWLVVAPGSTHGMRSTTCFVDLRLVDVLDVHARVSPPNRPVDTKTGLLEGREGYWDDPRCELLVECGDESTLLFVAEGPEAAARIVEQGAAIVGTASNATRDALARLLLVDGEPAELRDQRLVVGADSFAIESVRETARFGESLRLTGGRELQAALAMLVVGAWRRTTRT